MRSFLQFVSELTPEFKKNSLYIFLTYFFALFSYPLLRASTSAYFYEAYTSNEYSIATFVGIVGLMIVIGINNKFQPKFGVHRMYVFTCIAAIVSLILSFYFYKSGMKVMAFSLFAIKESYIVLLVHMCLAFANSFYSLEQIQRLFAPLGALGSLGGIIGGVLTVQLAKNYNTDTVFFVSLIFIAFAGFFFYLTKNTKVQGLKQSKSITPLRAISGIKKYVALIAFVVAMSQVVIFIADLQFNVIFEQIVDTADKRTAYLGEFYSYINLVSIILQFLVLPFILVRISTKNLFYFVPVLYFFLILLSFTFGVSSLMVTSGVFIMMKGTDYSIFAVAKEVVYHPLLSLQKFGAKYITDMFIYRLSKAIIAFVMAQIVIKDVTILSQLQVVFLILWVISVVLLFKEQKKININ